MKHRLRLSIAGPTLTLMLSCSPTAQREALRIQRLSPETVRKLGTVTNFACAFRFHR